MNFMRTVRIMRPVALAAGLLGLLTACGGGGGGGGTADTGVNAALVKYIGTWSTACDGKGRRDKLSVTAGSGGAVLMKTSTEVFDTNDCAGSAVAEITNGQTTTVTATGTRSVTATMIPAATASTVLADVVQMSWSAGKTFVLSRGANVSWWGFGDTMTWCVSRTVGELCLPHEIYTAGAQEDLAFANDTTLYDFEASGSTYLARPYTKAN